MCEGDGMEQIWAAYVVQRLRIKQTVLRARADFESFWMQALSGVCLLHQAVLFLGCTILGLSVLLALG